MILQACSPTSSGHENFRDQMPTTWLAQQDFKGKDPNIPSESRRNDKWWHSFEDKVLNHLIEQALLNNQNRKVARARILESRAHRLSTHSALYPQVGWYGKAARGRPGFQTLNMEQNLYEASFDSSFELDLFGANRKRVSAEDAKVAAAEAQYDHVTLSLISEVAREYTDWRVLQHSIELTRKMVKTQKTLCDLIQSRVEIGIDNHAVLAEANVIYRTMVSDLQLLEQKLAAVGFRLSVLIGEMPGSINQLINAPKPIPAPSILPVLTSPVQIITHRPDVRAAEWQLISGTALHAAATTEIFPKITFSAFFGVQDTNLLPSINIWSIASNIASPLLDFGRIQGQIKMTEAQKMQLLHSYKQTILEALSEVETALSNYTKEKKRYDDLKKALKDCEDILSLALIRYEKGIFSFLDVQHAKQKLYKIKIDLVNLEADQIKLIIAIYKALGSY